MFSHVKVGGTYYIEDLATSYMPVFEKNTILNPVSAIEFLKTLVEETNSCFYEENFLD